MSKSADYSLNIVIFVLQSNTNLKSIATLFNQIWRVAPNLILRIYYCNLLSFTDFSIYVFNMIYVSLLYC
jgi:hypothetical protein